MEIKNDLKGGNQYDKHNMLYRYKKFSVVSSLQYVFKGFKKENNKNLNKEQDDKHIPVDDITKQICRPMPDKIGKKIRTFKADQIK